MQIIGLHRVLEIFRLAEERKGFSRGILFFEISYSVRPCTFIVFVNSNIRSLCFCGIPAADNVRQERFLPAKNEGQTHTDYNPFQKVCITTLHTLHLWAVLWNVVDPAMVHWRKAFIWSTIECCTNSEPWTLFACRTDNWNKTSVMEWRLPGTLVLY